MSGAHCGVGAEVRLKPSARLEKNLKRHTPKPLLQRRTGHRAPGRHSPSGRDSRHLAFGGAASQASLAPLFGTAIARGVTWVCRAGVSSTGARQSRGKCVASGGKPSREVAQGLNFACAVSKPLRGRCASEAQGRARRTTVTRAGDSTSGEMSALSEKKTWLPSIPGPLWLLYGNVALYAACYMAQARSHVHLHSMSLFWSSLCSGRHQPPLTRQKSASPAVKLEQPTSRPAGARPPLPHHLPRG